MDYKITTMQSIKVIGFQEIFDMETAYDKIPEFWDRIWEKYLKNITAGYPAVESLRKGNRGQLYR